MRKLRAKAYGSTQWRKLSKQLKIERGGLCADCLAKGKINPASDCHHLRSPFLNGEINWNLLLDPENIVLLCDECHGLRHQHTEISPQALLDAFEELLKDIPDED